MHGFKFHACIDEKCSTSIEDRLKHTRTEASFSKVYQSRSRQRNSPREDYPNIRFWRAHEILMGKDKVAHHQRKT